MVFLRLFPEYVPFNPRLHSSPPPPFVFYRFQFSPLPYAFVSYSGAEDVAVLRRTNPPPPPPPNNPTPPTKHTNTPPHTQNPPKTPTKPHPAFEDGLFLRPLTVRLSTFLVRVTYPPPSRISSPRFFSRYSSVMLRWFHPCPPVLALEGSPWFLFLLTVDQPACP